MPDITPSGLHPAYPTREQLREEAEVERLVAYQITDATTFRIIIAAAVEKIECLDFPLGSPTQGYDLADIIATLRDLMPNIEDMTSVWREAARDRVREAV